MSPRKEEEKASQDMVREEGESMGMREGQRKGECTLADYWRHPCDGRWKHRKMKGIVRTGKYGDPEYRVHNCELQVCDDKWHSYSVLFDDIDNVSLVIDGKAFKSGEYLDWWESVWNWETEIDLWPFSDERNPEILDDWPLHKTKAVVRFLFFFSRTGQTEILLSMKKKADYANSETYFNQWK